MIIFTDIDDTLMQTKRKIIGDLAQCELGALDLQGNPLSYVTPKRSKLIQEMVNSHHSIPVTARSKASFKNVKINFSREVILNFGSTILDKNGENIQEWDDLMQSESKILKQDVFFENLEKMLLLEEDLMKHLEVKRRVEDGIFVFLNIRLLDVKNFIVKQQLLNFIKIYITPAYYVYETDRDVTVIPHFIKKEHAVSYLVENFYQDELIVGMGDHPNDLAFLKLCDFTLFPNDSLLMKKMEKK